MYSTPYKIDRSKDYRQRSSFSLLDNNFIALFTLIVLTCLITFWVWADRAPREMRYIYICSRVALGDSYRLFTAGFLHIDKSHLKNNMAALLIYGLLLCYRTKIPNIKFCLFYLSAILFSSHFAHQYNIHLPVDIKSLGASGGVFAVKYAALLVGFPPRKEQDNNAIMRILNIILFVRFFFGDYNKLSTSQSHIAHEVHFGGALYGIFFTVLCYPNLIFGNMFASTPASPKDKAADLHATAPLY